MAIDTSILKTNYASAAAAGDRLYLGDECARPGHGRIRYVSGRTCRECCREKGVRRRLRDQSSRTDPGGFGRRVFVLGEPMRIVISAGNDF